MVAKGGFTFEKQNVNTGRGLENARVEKPRRLTPWPTTRDQGGLKGKSLQRPPSASGGCFSRAHAGVETPSEQRVFKASQVLRRRQRRPSICENDPWCVLMGRV